MKHLRGEWDEALALVEAEVVRDAHYMQQVAHSIRAQIRLPRGDLRGAAEDAATMLAGARAVRDPQALDPALIVAAQVAHAHGDLAEANALLDELGAPERAAGTWVVLAAVIHRELGREPTWLLDRGDAPDTPWRQAARAIAEGDLERAVELLEPTGARTYVAAVRLHAARTLAGSGHAAEAATRLAAALAFYREVGATAYLREAEQLLAAAS